MFSVLYSIDKYNNHKRLKARMFFFFVSQSYTTIFTKVYFRLFFNINNILQFLCKQSNGTSDIPVKICVHWTQVHITHQSFAEFSQDGDKPKSLQYGVPESKRVQRFITVEAVSSEGVIVWLVDGKNPHGTWKWINETKS